MIHDLQSLEEQYKTFIEQTLTTKKIWTLAKNDELALLESQLYDNVISTPFFSNEAAARNLQDDEWYDFDIISITLSDFLEKWLVGLYNQDIMVAIIWNDVATGREFEPLELLLEYLIEIQQRDEIINFYNYNSTEHFINAIKDILT